MSFEDWVKNGWLESHRSSQEEIQNLLRIVRRDLKDSRSKDVSNDWRFAIAYNAALQAATATLAAAGYRASRDSHHPPGAPLLNQSFGDGHFCICPGCGLTVIKT